MHPTLNGFVTLEEQLQAAPTLKGPVMLWVSPAAAGWHAGLSGEKACFLGAQELSVTKGSAFHQPCWNAGGLGELAEGSADKMRGHTSTGMW